MKIDELKELDENTKIILNDLSEKYQSIIITRALLKNNLKNMSEISAIDLIKVDEEIIGAFQRTPDKRKKLNSLVRIIGLLYALIGLALYTFMSIKVENSAQIFSMLITGVGIFLTAFTYLYDYSREQLKRNNNELKNLNLYNNELEIVKKWNEIESLAYEIINKDNNNMSKSMPISKLFNQLSNEGILSDLEQDSYKEVLNLRNSIVHSSKKEISKEEIIKGIRTANQIIEKLKSKI